MSFKVIDKKQLKNFTKYGKKSAVKFDSEPLYGDNDKYIKAKIKIYRGKVNTNFQCKKLLKRNPSYKRLSLIMLDSVIHVSKKIIILKYF